MNRLGDIPIQVVHGTPDSGSLIGTVAPILNELEAMLEALLASGESHCIDLRRAPLGPKDYESLKDILGQGEVSATLAALGPTRIQETAVAGVWWVTHCNPDDEVVGEFIEVTDCPEMLKTYPADIRSGLQRLRSRLSSQPPPVTHPSDLTKRLAALGIRNSNILSHPDSNPLESDNNAE